MRLRHPSFGELARTGAARCSSSPAPSPAERRHRLETRLRGLLGPWRPWCRASALSAASVGFGVAGFASGVTGTISSIAAVYNRGPRAGEDDPKFGEALAAERNCRGVSTSCARSRPPCQRTGAQIGIANGWDAGTRRGDALGGLLLSLTSANADRVSPRRGVSEADHGRYRLNRAARIAHAGRRNAHPRAKREV